MAATHVLSCSSEFCLYYSQGTLKGEPPDPDDVTCPRCGQSATLRPITWVDEFMRPARPVGGLLAQPQQPGDLARLASEGRAGSLILFGPRRDAE